MDSVGSGRDNNGRQSLRLLIFFGLMSLKITNRYTCDKFTLD